MDYVSDTYGVYGVFLKDLIIFMWCYLFLEKLT